MVKKTDKDLLATVPCAEGGVYIIGSLTYKCRADIKANLGGVWNAVERKWRVPQENVGLVDDFIIHHIKLQKDGSCEKMKKVRKKKELYNSIPPREHIQHILDEAINAAKEMELSTCSCVNNMLYGEDVFMVGHPVTVKNTSSAYPSKKCIRVHKLPYEDCKNECQKKIIAKMEAIMKFYKLPCYVNRGRKD